jgi:V/A-type H+-transporting ATPase subunit C
MNVDKDAPEKVEVAVEEAPQLDAPKGSTPQKPPKARKAPKFKVPKARRDRRPRTRDYGYGNARTRGMKSNLLGAPFFEELMGVSELGKMIGLLSGTGYGPDIDAQLIRGASTAVIDDALKDNMVRTFDKVMGFVNDEARLLSKTLLGRWDLFNIKTIIRGKHMKLKAEAIVDSLLPVGEMTQVELKELAGLQDVLAVTDTLWTWGVAYSIPLRESVQEYLQENDLSVLELALDRYYSQWAAKRVSSYRSNYKLARLILGLQVDSTNLVTTFRLLKADTTDMEVARFFLPGGVHVTEELFLRLTTLSDVDEVIDALKGTPYSQQLEKVLVAYLDANSISVLERALEDYVMRKALGSGFGDPLGFGVMVSYLYAKQNEVTNLRIIIKGNAVGMPPDRMRKELIFV